MLTKEISCLKSGPPGPSAIPHWSKYGKYTVINSRWECSREYQLKRKDLLHLYKILLLKSSSDFYIGSIFKVYYFHIFTDVYASFLSSYHVSLLPISCFFVYISQLLTWYSTCFQNFSCTHSQFLFWKYMA